MTKKNRPNFSPEFRLETEQLIVDQGCSHKEAADAMGVGYSTLDKWMRQLREELFQSIETTLKQRWINAV